MISACKWIVSPELDPYRNIAQEKYLTVHSGEGTCVLYLWRNRRSVIIGRNQNPWEECRVPEMKEDGVCLARRLSGGGAVYHDPGNVNFSFLTRKENFDPGRQSEVILRGMRKLGIPAERTGRNDLTAEGRKFSGNAFYETGGCSCHHGTIMLEVDTSAMEKYLSVPAAKLRSRGIHSVRSRVINLKEISPEISVPALREGLLEAFQEVYGMPAEPLEPDSRAKAEIRREAEHLASPEWLFPPRIPFTAEISGRFPWGGVRIGLWVRGDRVQAAECESDAMDERLIREIQGALPGCLFDGEAMAERVRIAAEQCGEADGDVFPRARIARDLIEWILAQRW